MQLEFTKLDGVEFNTLASLKKECDRKMTEVVPFYNAFTRYYEDKTLQTIFNCERLIMRALLRMDGFTVPSLPNQRVSESAQLIEYILRYSHREVANQDVGFRMAMLLLYALCTEGSKENDNVISQLVQCVQNGALQIKESDKASYTYLPAGLQALLKNSALFAPSNIKYILNKYKEKLGAADVCDNGRLVPSAIDIMCRLINVGDYEIYDALFAGDPLQGTGRVGARFSHSAADELALAKAHYYVGSASSVQEMKRQHDADVRSFQRRERVFIYVAGGVTPAERTAVWSRSCEPGRLGLFNQGTQAGDREFVLISDFTALPSEFLRQLG